MMNYALMQQALPVLLYATGMSLKITALSSVIGITLGTVLGIAQLENSRIIRFIIGTYVTIIRGTPMLIQISFYYFALGLPAFWAAIAGIGLNSAAYVSQIIRTGIKSISSGQIQAAQVLGLSKYQITRFIILPQAIRTVLPTLGNEFITLIKDSALASTVGVVELFRQASIIINRTYEPLPVYMVMALIYLVLTGTLSIAVHYLERRLHRASH